MKKSNLTEMFQGHIKVLSQELGLDYEEVRNILVIQEFKNPERAGTVQVQRKVDGSISKIILYIKLKMSWTEILLALSHEMVHVKQNITGDIQAKYLSKSTTALRLVISKKRIKSKNIWRLYEQNYRLYFKGNYVQDFFDRECDIELEAKRAELDLAKILVNYEIENDILPLVS